jgi:hypothetical protein
MRFLHDGQLEGKKRFSRIQLNRCLVEENDGDVEALYAALFEALGPSAVGRGESELLETSGWEGNHTHNALTAIQWQRWGDTRSFDVVIVSQSKERVQGNIRITAQGVRNGKWLLQDRLSPERWERDGDELAGRGLYVDVPPHAAQLFSFTRA